jgi:hypothetical protein
MSFLPAGNPDRQTGKRDLLSAAFTSFFVASIVDRQLQKTIHAMSASTIHQNIYHILRIAAAMCFIGHGAFGIITKPIWCNYMALFGIGPELAYQLMPVVGTIDILLGFSLLVYPSRAVALWLVFWGILTASMRPLAGEPFAEMIERAGNYGAPLAMLLILGKETSLGAWFKKLDAEAINKAAVSNLAIWCLKVSSFLLLSGHGWLNLIHKPGLLAQYDDLGFTDPAATATIIGCLEIMGAFSVLIKPLGSVLLLLFVWKIVSEMFYPHFGIWEWVERGGSYACLLGLLLLKTLELGSFFRVFSDTEAVLR